MENKYVLKGEFVKPVYENLQIREDIAHYLIHEPGMPGFSTDHPEAKAWNLDPAWLVYVSEIEDFVPYEFERINGDVE